MLSVFQINFFQTNPLRCSVYCRNPVLVFWNVSIRLNKFLYVESLHPSSSSWKKVKISFQAFFFLVFVTIYRIIYKLIFWALFCISGHWNCSFYVFIYSTSKQSVWFSECEEPKTSYCLVECMTWEIISSSWS